MDDQERASFLLEQEKLGKAIAPLRAELRSIGNTLMHFGERVRDAPERLFLENAPPPFNEIPEGATPSNPIGWDEILDKKLIIEKVRELQKLHTQSRDIKRKLGVN